MVFLASILSRLVLSRHLVKVLLSLIISGGCYLLPQSRTVSSLISRQFSLQVPQMNNTIKFENFDVGFSPLEEGFQPEPKVLVFRNQQTWDKFWASSSFMDVNLQKLPALMLILSKTWLSP